MSYDTNKSLHLLFELQQQKRTNEQEKNSKKKKLKANGAIDISRYKLGNAAK